ncbi:hypothetical protein ACEWY4_007517 [Coilia grayii]|uniref:Aspartyl beta-hydroxylase/Triadin domain-containing protein n=1 Tax=Coilia grayii TaxID=363190 RepID=A0ABD1KGP7_9TELE
MAQKKNARGHKKGPEAKQQSTNKNGKKSEGAGATSFFTWFMVLALLGVWTSVAVVYFDLVDYQGVLAKAKDLHHNLSEVLKGKLVSYDADGDGDFDVEDAKVLLDEPGDLAKKHGEPDHALAKDVGTRLKEALKMQLAIIHERVEAKKIAKMALAEVRNILAKEEEEKLMDQRREETQAWERVEVHLKEESMRMEREIEKKQNGTKIERDELTEKEVKKLNRDDEEREKLERVKKVSMPTMEVNMKEVEVEAKSGKSKGHSKSRKKSTKSSV